MRLSLFLLSPYARPVSGVLWQKDAAILSPSECAGSAARGRMVPVAPSSLFICPPGEWRALAERRCHFVPERLRGACGTRANAPVSLPSQSVCPPGEWRALAERRCHFVPERLRGACGTRANAPVSLPSQSVCPPGEWRALAERRCHFAPEQVRGVCGTRADGACRSSLSVHMPARWAAYKENRGGARPTPHKQAAVPTAVSCNLETA